MNAEQLRELRFMANCHNKAPLWSEFNRKAIADVLADVERLTGELATVRAQLATGKPQPTQDENDAAEMRLKRIDAMYAVHGSNRDKWPQHAQEAFAQLDTAQREYEAKYC